MDWLDFGQLHARIRAAQLPGYSLTYNEGADQFALIVYGHNGEQCESRDHSSSILLEWFDETLEGLKA